MKKFLSLHIHSNWASWSSDDVNLYKEVELVKDNEFTENEKYGNKEFMVHCLPSDKTFYNNREDCSKLPQFKNLIKKYKALGWKLDTEIEGFKEMVKNYWIEVKNERAKERKSNGFVVYDYEKMSKEDYQGGFSNFVFNQKRLQDYLSGQIPFGYISHSIRKNKIDEYIEKQFLNLKEDKEQLADLLACWLTSSDGRHFGDSLEVESFEEQKAIIDENIKDIYNTSFIYSQKEHNGTYKSTLELKEKLKDKLLV
jgi:hypothetical protein